MRKRIYATSIVLSALSVVVTFAFLFWVFGSILLRTDIPLPSLGRGLVAFYVLGLFGLLRDLHVPLSPLLNMFGGGLFGTLAITVLIVRRLLIWQRFSAASPPAGHGSVSATLLAICIFSLLVALVGMLVAPLLVMNREIAYVFRLFGALTFSALLSLPAQYLFGITVLVTELKSIKHEGWWPRPNLSLNTDAQQNPLCAG